VTTAPVLGRPILPHGHPFDVRVKTRGVTASLDADLAENVLAGALETDALADAVIAKSDSEREAMWSL
jgi:hypothetical protein